MDRSDSGEKRDDFVGFRCNSDQKRRAKQRAKGQGLSLSEWMRCRLRDLDEAADDKAVTT